MCCLREKQRAQPTVGMVYTEAPRLVSIKEDIETHTTTSFTVVDDAPDDEARKDGVTRRIKIPSWDDIMFGKDKED